MRRAVARGRMFPQSYSTDRRYGRLSLKAIGLFPLMWANADDQGRLCGDPEEIKYAVCPNIDHITKQDIPDLLQELQDNKLILCYNTPKSMAIQMLDWWDANLKMQWAWPSEYPASNGWQDRLRYKKGSKEVVTENWLSGENPSSPQVSNENVSGESSGETTEAPSPEQLGGEIRSRLMTLPQAIDHLAEHEAIKDALAKMAQARRCLPKSEITIEEGRVDLVWEDPTGQIVAAFEIDVFSPRKKSLLKLKALDCRYQFVILRSNSEALRWEGDILIIGLGKEREGSEEKETLTKTITKTIRGRGNSPESSGEYSGENLPASLQGLPLHQFITETFQKAFGRNPNSREVAQIRELGNEVSSAGGATAAQVHDAFKEAALQNKLHLSYARAILLDWLGIKREPPA